MSRIIDCQKLGKAAEGLARPPYPGELGQRIYNEISAPAWQQWLTHQTMLINEYRLDMSDKKSRDFLKQEMQKFLFAGEDIKPADYTPPEEN